MRTLTLWLIGVGFVLGLAVAQDGALPPQPDVAALRVANLSSEATEIGILVGGEVVFESVAAGVVSGYRTVAAGEHEVAAVEPKPAEDEDGEPDSESVGLQQEPVSADPMNDGIIDRDVLSGPTAVTLEPGRYYTLVIAELGSEERRGADGAQNGGAGNRLQAYLLADDLGSFPPAGHASVRVINFAPDSSTSSVEASPVGSAARGARDAPTAPGGASRPRDIVELGANVALGEAGGYVGILPGRYDIWFRPDDDSVLQELASVEWQAGAIYSCYIYGRDQDGSRSVIVTVDALVRDRPPSVPGRSVGER